MILVVLQLLPLAVAAIAPTLVGLVILFLSTEQGRGKAWAFIWGKYVASFLWGILFLIILGNAHLTQQSTAHTRPVLLLIEIVVGGLLIVLALRCALVEQDSDEPPPKILALLDKLGPVVVFVANLLWSLLQIRFVLLLFAGTTTIATAALPGIEPILTLLILAVLMIWPLLVPVGIFLFMGERRATAIQAMRAWLTSKQRLINAVVLAAVGLVLIVRGVVVL